MKPFSLSSWRWRFLFGVALVAALPALVDLRRLGAAVARADGPLLGAALAAAGGAIVVLEARRFQAAFAGWDLRYGAALRITLASLFVGSFTPGAVGAEAYKLYAVHRRGEGVVRPVVKLALLRLLGAAALAAAIAAAGLAAPAGFGAVARRLAWRWPAGRWFAGRWFAGRFPLPALGAAALVVLSLAALGLGWPRLAPRLREAWRQGREALAEVRPAQAGEIFLLSLGVALLRGVSLTFLVRSFGESVPFADLLGVVALSLLAGTLPISPAGLGVQEGILAGCLVFFHVPPPSAVAIALLSRAFLWLFAAIGGWALAASRRALPRPAPR
ncbi:MAG TPA: lysylphosphatidylglycerol synthase transmembrane domain-containing protein [Thermoanaerobaculia bacterium]|nr:lysylphosphatidylglycerol synthase transmembrane domain-containing protein [Thermoanaerobaculia bacterium]